MASPFAFAWMLLKDSARVAPPNPQYPQEDDGRDEPRRQFEQPQHPPMPHHDEGPTLGEMANMDPEEAEFERALLARRKAPKPEDPAQTQLHQFD